MNSRLNLTFIAVLLTFIGGCNQKRDEYVILWEGSGALPREKGAWVFVKNASGGNERVQDGLWETWYSNGQKKSSFIFIYGRIVGTSQFWHANGQLAQTIPYDRDGLPHGMVNWWDSNGRFLTNSLFTHGAGVNYIFDDNGNLHSANAVRSKGASEVRIRKPLKNAPFTGGGGRK